MAIEFQHTIDLPQPPQEVFATLADVSQTPRWLARCTGIERLSPGPLEVGSKLRYTYKEGGRSGVMDGQVTERVDGRALGFAYDDRMMHVTVRFALEPSAVHSGGTRLTHSIGITPKTLMAKLFAPMIRKGLPRQTTEAMESLRSLLARR